MSIIREFPKFKEKKRFKRVIVTKDQLHNIRLEILKENLNKTNKIFEKAIPLSTEELSNKGKPKKKYRLSKRQKKLDITVDLLVEYFKEKHE